MFKIIDLPPEIKHPLHKKAKKEASAQKRQQILAYSENMIVIAGRKGLHIFDIDRERWVFNSTKTGYNYQDHYYAARNIENSDEEAHAGDSDFVEQHDEEEKLDDLNTINQFLIQQEAER